ncbi:MAG TPA: hypothetical protein ENK57_15630 [Polyangiaceae bacterium]|nr:hypothetical protein [Polyangiaceae bacterium]
MTYTLIVSSRASDQHLDALAYYEAEEDLARALDFDDVWESGLAEIALDPSLWRYDDGESGGDPTRQRIYWLDRPYGAWGVRYRVMGERIEVLTLRHAAADPGGPFG